jgi:hypothetical protein
MGGWADLGGPQIYHLSFYILRSVPKTQSAHEWDLELVYGADFGRNLHYFSSRGRSRGSRGPGPKGPKTGQKPGARFIILSSLRSAQIYHFVRPALLFQV